MKHAQLPSTLVEAEMIDTIAHWLDLCADLLRTENSRRVIRARLKALIRQGTIPTVRVIEYANQGIVDADEVLREVIAEMLDHGETLPATLAGYAAGALLKDRGPHGKDAGRAEVAADNWLRDQVIAIVVAMAVERWSPYLPHTRGRASRTRPSACSLVSSALVKRNISISERRIEVISHSLADLLVQHRAWLANRPL